MHETRRGFPKVQGARSGKRRGRFLANYLKGHSALRDSFLLSTAA